MKTRSPKPPPCELSTLCATRVTAVVHPVPLLASRAPLVLPPASGWCSACCSTGSPDGPCGLPQPFANEQDDCHCESDKEEEEEEEEQLECAPIPSVGDEFAAVATPDERCRCDVR